MTSPNTPPGQSRDDAPEPEPMHPAGVPKPREIPCEQLDHQMPADAEPDEPASP